MAGTTNLNEHELESLRKGVVGAGLLVSVSDRGFIDTFKEAGALAKHVTRARENSNSELVREVAEVRGAGFDLTSSPQEVESETLDALRTSVSTLETKAPEEVDAYREFVLDVAESVAGAAESSGTAESGAIAKIRSALGADSAA